MTTGVFISYSTRDRKELENLLSALRRADEDVWFDEELGGGDVWWQKILEGIRACEVFVFALSNNSLESKPCLAELRYAQALGKTVLPVQIGEVASLRVTPLAAVEAIDFRTPTVDSGIRLITAVQRARELAAPLPSPLPEEPPVPFGYLMRLAAAINGDSLDPHQQGEILAELDTMVAQDGDDAAGDIAQLLRNLQNRPDTTEASRAEARRLLAALGTPAAVNSSTNSVVPQSKSRPRTLMIAAAAAVAVIAAIVVGYALRQRPAPAAAPTTTAAEPTKTMPPINPANVGSLLLSPGEANTVTGMTDLTGDPPDSELFAPTAELSDPDCLGADYAAAKPVYDGTGWSAVSAQNLSQTAPDDPDTTVLWIDQAAVTFPTEHQALAFRDKSTTQWKGCSGKVVKDDIGTVPMTWTFDDVTAENEMISQISFQEGAEGGGCQHTLTTYSNVVLEAVVCGPDFKGQAPRIVAKMLEKAEKPV